MTKGNYFLRKEPVGSQSKDKKSKPSVTWGSFVWKFLFIKQGSPVYMHVYSVICYVNLLCSWAVLHILLSLMFLLTYREKGANRITIFCHLFPVFFEETTIRCIQIRLVNPNKKRIAKLIKWVQNVLWASKRLQTIREARMNVLRVVNYFIINRPYLVCNFQLLLKGKWQA